MGIDSLQFRALGDGDPIALMTRETVAREAMLPAEIDGEPFPRDDWRFGTDWFAFDVPGLRFLYRRGQGIAWQCLDENYRVEAPLYLSGSVYSAVASLNGLFPLHVSAVLYDGRVHAFGGPSGAGKSTFVAALGDAGFALVADDTLLLELEGDGPPLCLPGHKRLKLVRDAFMLTAATREEVADPRRDKFYAQPARLAPNALFPLASITFLEEGPEVRLERLGSGARLARLREDHYTTWMFELAQQMTAERRFALQAKLARGIDAAVLTRPRDTDSFPKAVALATDYIRTGKA
jgi:hypothetical protein